MSKEIYGAGREAWLHFDVMLGLTADLLPVVSNPHATISANSAMKGLGKTPSRYNGNGEAVGFAQWTQYRSTAEDIEKWSKQDDYGICLQSRKVRFIDVDIDDAGVAREVQDEIASRGFNLPVRYRENSAKCLFAFELRGDYTKRKFKAATGIVEFLADGQQAIVAGQHPSGVRYEWRGGLPDAFPVLTGEEFERLWSALVERFATEGDTQASASTKAQKLAEVVSGDPVAQYLMDKNLVRKMERDGRLHIICPWEEDHTSDSSESATTYWPAHTGGYANGHFLCMHAHCEHREDYEFKEAIGYAEESLLSEFDAIAETQAVAGVAAQTTSSESEFAEGVSREPVATEPATQTLERDGQKSTADTTASRFRVHPAHEFAHHKPQRWIVKNVIPQAEMAVVYGDSGSGKTFFILDMVACIAQGLEWRGNRTRKSRVVYVAAEGAGGFRNRLKAYAHHHQIALTDLPIGVIAAAPNMMEKADAVELAKSIVHSGGADIVVLDTFAQVMPGANENSGEDVGKALAHCKGIHRATGALVILIHHSGKDASKGARGWSGLRAAADAEIEIVRADSARAATVTKLKDGEDGMEFGFVLNTVTVGFDEDGDEITSCVLEHNDTGRPQRKKEVKGVIEKMILTAIEDAGPMSEEDIVELLKGQLPRGAGQDQRPKRIKRAVRALTDTRRLAIDGINLKIKED